MSRFVLDASIALAWCFEGEENALANRLFEYLATGRTAIVPSIWAIEIASGLWNGERRKRLTRFKVARLIAFLESLPLDVDVLSGTRALTQTHEVARVYDLTAYDATYLELAIREGLMLATLDAKLKAAAHQAGVPVFS